MPTPAKPLPLHKLQGTKSEATPSPEIAPSRPRYPKGLTGDGRKIFKKLAGVLERRHALTEGEEELLRLYTTLFIRHAKALVKLEEEGEVVAYSRLNNRGEEVQTMKPNLWLAIAQDAEKGMTGILDRLGLSPLNRGKVKSLVQPKEVKPVDPMAEILNRPRAAETEPEQNLDEIDEDSVVM